MLAVFNIIAIIAQKIIIMEQDNTDIINLPKGSYVTLPKDEYMELQSLKNKDYDFEKRVSEIKYKYNKNLNDFKQSTLLVVDTTEYHTSSFTSYGYLLKTYGLKKDLLKWLKSKFGIECIKYDGCGTTITMLDGRIFIDKEDADDKLKKDLELRDKIINDVKNRNKVLERYFRITRKSPFSNTVRKIIKHFCFNY